MTMMKHRDSIEKRTEKRRLNPQLGDRWTERYAHVGLVVDYNKYAVALVRATYPIDNDHYCLNYKAPVEIWSRTKFEKVMKHCELLSDGPHPTYQDYLDTPDKFVFTLPETPEEIKQLLDSEDPNTPIRPEPYKYVTLVLTRNDLRRYSSIREVEIKDVKDTGIDVMLSDRVIFMDLDGSSIMLKNKSNPNNLETKIIQRPDSFKYFNIKVTSEN